MVIRGNYIVRKYIKEIYYILLTMLTMGVIIVKQSLMTTTTKKHFKEVVDRMIASMIY